MSHDVAFLFTVVVAAGVATYGVALSVGEIAYHRSRFRRKRRRT